MTEKKRKDEVPVIFWYSDPIYADETLLLTGHGFSKISKVEFCRLDDKEASSFNADKARWVSVIPLQADERSLKAVVPKEFKNGIFVCRVKEGRKASAFIFLNSPAVWWTQGEKGVGATVQGGWLRFLGKSLNFGGKSVLMLKGNDKEIFLKAEKASCYNLEFKIPDDFACGEYTVFVHNGFGGKDGWRKAGMVMIKEVSEEKEIVLNILSFGADPKGRKSSSHPLDMALFWAESLAGRKITIYFPRGRYIFERINPDESIPEPPFRIPKNVAIRGESKSLVSLWWPDRKMPPEYLFEGVGFTMESLSFYVQGNHGGIVLGRDNVCIRNLRIRAMAHFGLRMRNRKLSQFGKPLLARPKGSPNAIVLKGENNKILDCDIYQGNISLRWVTGSIVTGNRCRTIGMVNCRQLICEHNKVERGGSNISVFYGNVSENIYFAHNQGDRILNTGNNETLTFDGRSSIYIGGIKKADGNKLVLNYAPDLTRQVKYMNRTLHEAVVYIVWGRGAGQYRFIKYHNGKEIEIEQAWAIEPDEDSVIIVGGFNGRHLIIDNVAEDCGTLVQLYKMSCECIVAENRSVRTGGINCYNVLTQEKKLDYAQTEIGWYNQYLDNRVVEGNAWGSRRDLVDTWHGGETQLLLWGVTVIPYTSNEAKAKPAALIGLHYIDKKILSELIGREWTEKTCLPICSFQIIRRHIIDNNSAIYIRGAVSDVLVEKCNINDSFRGIRVDAEIYGDWRETQWDQDSLEPEPEDCKIVEFLAPHNIILRKNRFRNVERKYYGTKIDNCLIIE